MPSLYREDSSMPETVFAKTDERSYRACDIWR